MQYILLGVSDITLNFSLACLPFWWFRKSWEGWQAHFNSVLSYPGVATGHHTVLYRVRCAKMEIILCNSWYSMESSLPGGIWLWNSRGFVLSRAYEIPVGFSLKLTKSLTFICYIFLNSSYFLLFFLFFLFRSVLEEDEVCSVARLLGDLVAYRASGTGHLELLAGSSPWIVTSWYNHMTLWCFIMFVSIFFLHAVFFRFYSILSVIWLYHRVIWCIS